MDAPIATTARSQFRFSIAVGAGAGRISWTKLDVEIYDCRIVSSLVLRNGARQTLQTHDGFCRGRREEDGHISV